MRREVGGLLHPELAAVIAGLGHGQRLVISDAGLPIPPGVRRIDLAVRCGVPSFADVLSVVGAELAIERVVIATESDTIGRGLIREILAQALAVPALVDTVSHEELKEMSASAVAVVRTGECTSYLNVVLVAGVSF
jgi:D-ribose pyranase